METVKSEVKNYCNSLYKELYHMKIKLGRFATIIEQDKIKGKDELITYVRHLHDIVSFLEWKMEIFNKVCPVEWDKFGEHFETDVSVPPVELTETDQTASGYLGG